MNVTRPKEARFCEDDRLSEEARRLLAEAEAEDAREDALDADEQAALRGRLPAGFASERERCARLDEAAQRLAEEPQPDEAAPAAERPARESVTAKGRGHAIASARRGKRNRTDPNSRVLRTRTGFIQAYNAQVAVGESHVVLACAVGQDNGDNRLLEPMVMRTEETLQAVGATDAPCLYLADGGYWSGGAVEELEAEGRRLLVKPNGRPPTRGLPASGPVAKMGAATRPASEKASLPTPVRRSSNP